MATPEVSEVAVNKQFGGFNRRYKHKSSSLGCEMTFTIYYPPAAAGGKVPVLYFLSGLTCNDEIWHMCMTGAQRQAAARGVALIAPDTSPRGLGVEGESESWDFGVGAGFYVNATQPKWKNWRMYEYVTEELPALLRAAPLGSSLDLDRASVFGHSMGGHGALVVGLRNPTRFRTISAFSPISNPINAPWGVKAFTGYLGEDKAAWKEYDASELLRGFNGDVKPAILVDTGSADKFLTEQLKPDSLEAAAKESGYGNVTVRMQDGYDHSYFFISSFIDDHINFHADALTK
ncbi:hypothetical protein CHLRE_03g158800v5 [Chlamydomonas reinhardtii]|uniref:S-formylglutathione hydrolase n=1 Tax=Chlamydomonas reinhardtii TaxID=3055 RepID=A0A2K3DW85_CHLRE|nr:uncharacterized protein CHLRE_03g158800v5 [Chlamydomonas reinhardtii]PNW84789.1 hypothetical protein CHLRE_03g158800v5 [Chlamydomonas reinhardtii]